MNTIAEQSIGLSFAEIHLICEDITKDFLVYGSEEVSQRKNYFHMLKTENNRSNMLSHAIHKTHIILNEHTEMLIQVITQDVLLK